MYKKFASTVRNHVPKRKNSHTWEQTQNKTEDKKHIKAERNRTLTHYGMQKHQNREADFHLEQAPSTKFSKTTNINKGEKDKKVLITIG